MFCICKFGSSSLKLTESNVWQVVPHISVSFSILNIWCVDLGEKQVINENFMVELGFVL